MACALELLSLDVAAVWVGCGRYVDVQVEGTSGYLPTGLGLSTTMYIPMVERHCHLN